VLADKVVVVTGASRGIGRAIALACAREGAIVGINFHHSEEDARSLAEEIAARHGRPAHLLPFDVTDAAAIASAVARFSSLASRIDGWVNNAAVNLPSLLATSEVDAIRAQLETNLLGPILCARAVVRQMMARRAGTIVNVGSVASARPTAGQAAYAASKGGLASLTRALAVEYGRKGIRVVGVDPGPIDTAMLGPTKAMAEQDVFEHLSLRRLGEGIDVAELVVFLLSDRARFITGSIHAVDGGYLLG